MLGAAAYYEAYVPKLGTDFISTIEIAVLDLSDDPEKWPVIGKGIRSCPGPCCFGPGCFELHSNGFAKSTSC
jgi:hypothetical protein